MSQQTNTEKFWELAKQGWLASILLGLLLLALPFKDIIYGLIKAPELLNDLASTSPFWQEVVKNVLIDDMGTKLEQVLPAAIVVGGAVLVAYSVIFGYLRTYRALDINSNYANVKKRKAGDITIGSIATRSLFINIPVIYWAVFLFVALPRLVQLPINAISTGSIPFLVITCLFMITATVAATHIGLLASKLSLRFIVRGG